MSDGTSLDDTGRELVGLPLRALSVLPRFRRVRDQIIELDDCWRIRNRAELRALAPADLLMVALGDSLSQGVGASSLDATWPLELACRMGRTGPHVRLVNLSCTGARVSDVIRDQLPRLDELPRRPDVVTCTVGSNDLMWSVRLQTARDQMSELIAELPPGSVIATVPDRRSFAAKALNRRIRSEAERAAVDVADVAAEVVLNRRTLAADGFHPNDSGYLAWLDAFGRVLVEDSSGPVF